MMRRPLSCRRWDLTPENQALRVHVHMMSIESSVDWRCIPLYGLSVTIMLGERVIVYRSFTQRAILSYHLCEGSHCTCKSHAIGCYHTLYLPAKSSIYPIMALTQIILQHPSKFELANYTCYMLCC